MKRIGILLGISLLILTGCTNEDATEDKNKDIEQKTMTCTETQILNGIKTETQYKIHYTNQYIDSIDILEKSTAEDKKILQSFKQAIEGYSYKYDNLPFYNYDIYMMEDALIVFTNIDYSKIDLNMINELDPSFAVFFKNGKVNVNDIQQWYEQGGATCSK